MRTCLSKMLMLYNRQANKLQLLTLCPATDRAKMQIKLLSNQHILLLHFPFAMLCILFCLTTAFWIVIIDNGPMARSGQKGAQRLTDNGQWTREMCPIYNCNQCGCTFCTDRNTIFPLIGQLPIEANERMNEWTEWRNELWHLQMWWIQLSAV